MDERYLTEPCAGCGEPDCDLGDAGGNAWHRDCYSKAMDEATGLTPLLSYLALSELHAACVSGEYLWMPEAVAADMIDTLRLLAQHDWKSFLYFVQDNDVLSIDTRGHAVADHIKYRVDVHAATTIDEIITGHTKNG